MFSFIPPFALPLLIAVLTFSFAACGPRGMRSAQNILTQLEKPLEKSAVETDQRKAGSQAVENPFIHCEIKIPNSTELIQLFAQPQMLDPAKQREVQQTPFDLGQSTESHYPPLKYVYYPVNQDLMFIAITDATGNIPILRDNFARQSQYSFSIGEGAEGNGIAITVGDDYQISCH